MTSPDELSHLRHELRTPLNHIIGFSEMLLEEAEDTGASSLVPALNQVHADARELLGRLNALLAAATSAADCAPERLAAELSPSLHRVVACVDALKAEAAVARAARAFAQRYRADCRRRAAPPRACRAAGGRAD